jgi:membrane-associated phospholipid phosphatase
VRRSESTGRERRTTIAAPHSSAEDAAASPRRQLIALWTLVAVFAAITVLRSHLVGIPLRDPHGEILRNRLLISLGLLVGLAVVDGFVRTPRAGRRPGAVVRVLRERWTPRRIALAIAVLLAYHLVYFCYHNLKSWVAFRPLHDDTLRQWDHWLFLGHTPAVMLHDLLGQHVAAYVLMVIYESFTTLISLCVVASVVFVDRVEDGFVFLFSGVWVWILGAGSYYLIPAIGPFHAAPRDFSGLPHTMIQDTQAKYLDQRAHLLADPRAHDAFAQIGAFASLHIAMTTLVLLMAHHFGLRRAVRAMVVFVGLTMVATVYLGWHYAVDDLAGMAIAVVATMLGGVMVRGGRRERVRVTTSSC